MGDLALGTKRRGGPPLATRDKMTVDAMINGMTPKASEPDAISATYLHAGT
jgi:hypothetical protein